MEAFTGTVVRGKQLGRTIGYPTANIEADVPTPEGGVYAVVAVAEGRRYPAVMNVGAHPTLPEGAPTIEVHLIGFQGDLYGRRLRVEPVRRLRAERRFESIGALRAQLARDCEQARTLIAL